MNNKIKSLLAALLLLTGAEANAQTAYNPFTQNIHFATEPSSQGFACGSLQKVVFTQGLTTAADATLWQTQPLKVVVCISGFSFDAKPEVIATGSFASKFDWSFDPAAPNCIIGTQNQTLKGTGGNPLLPVSDASGDIELSLKVPETSPLGTVLSVDVNLQVPTYMADFNSVPDDNEATQTQSFCALSIEGMIYADNNNDAQINGTPIASADGQILYAHLIGADNRVVQVMPIATNGSYEFRNVNANTNYTILLSSVQGVVGQAAPAVLLPGKWVNTGEDCCDRTGNDGLADGLIAIQMTNASKTNVNFGISDMANVGSVTIKNFFVSEFNCNGLLSWTTSEEANTLRTDIYRRENNGSFVKVATVQNAGSSSNDKIYSYVDKDVKSGINYEYQLMFVYKNGQTLSSSIKPLTLNCSKKNISMNLFPNPVSGELNVYYVTETDNTKLELSITDMAGRVLSSRTKIINSGASVITFDVAHYAEGNYMLNYKDKTSLKSGSLQFAKH